MEVRWWKWRIRRRRIRRRQQRRMEIRWWKWRIQRRRMEIRRRWWRIRRRRRRWRLVVILMALTNKRSKIRSPIIRAYLGRKHQLSKPTLRLALSTLRHSPDQKTIGRPKKPKSGGYRGISGGRTKKLPGLSPNKFARESATAYNARATIFVILHRQVQRYLLGTVNDIVASLPAIRTCRRVV